MAHTTPQELTPEQSDRYRASLDYLYGRINYERLSRPSPTHPMKLARMRALLTELGDPQSTLRIVHIGGTKGKGSTAAIVAAIATANGYRTGVYSSPHLQSLEERFAIDGKPASAMQLSDLVDRIRPAAECVERSTEGMPTFFELTTAMALMHFAEHRCDLVALEVGLGGRLDSTNVCQPLVAAITSIGLDHQHILGDTVELIAAEKAGIIKDGTPVIIGVENAAAADVIRGIAAERGAPAIEVNHDFSACVQDDDHDWGSTFDFLPLGEASAAGLVERRGLRLSLEGKHQVANAGIALAIIDQLSAEHGDTFRFADGPTREALTNIQLHGKVERVEGQPLIILDTAHNPDSVTALCDVIQDRFADRNVVVVFGTSSDKDAKQMLSLLVPAVKQIILTRYRKNPRWQPPQKLAAILQEIAGQSWEVVEQAPDAVEVARRRAGTGGVVVVCGSFFLAAELREKVLQFAAS